MTMSVRPPWIKNKREISAVVVGMVVVETVVVETVVVEIAGVETVVAPPGREVRAEQGVAVPIRHLKTAPWLIC
jgi:hypothetical protein